MARLLFSHATLVLLALTTAVALYAEPNAATAQDSATAGPANPILLAQFRGGGNGGWQSPGGATGGSPFVPPSAPSVVPVQPVPQPPMQPLPRTFVPAPVYPQGNVLPGPHTGRGVWATPPPSSATSNIPGTTVPIQPRTFAPATGSTWSKAPAGASGNNKAANSGAILSAQPAIQQHLQKQGQNFQAWSANRQEAFNRYHLQNARRLEQFLQYRDPAWAQLNQPAADRVRLARQHGAAWNTYRQGLSTYRYDRAAEVRDHLRDSCDHLFTLDWWRLHRGRDFLIGAHSPWWWWNPCGWNSAIAFCGFGWSQPIYYDYGYNVIVDGDVYVDGQDAGPAADYAQQAIDLANPQAAVPEPMPPETAGQPDEWQPFGVFALTQEKEGDAIMFLQLAVNRQGQIGGAFTNTLAGDTEPITGAIDRTTQKAAWHVGDKSNTVFEAGTANLTQDVAPVLIHFGAQSTQTWLLVRLASPDLPIAPPQPASSPDN